MDLKVERGHMIILENHTIERWIINAYPRGFVNFCSYEMLPLEEQLELANQIGTTRSLILMNLVDLSVGTSFL